jgi:hypothetical protein
VSLSPTEAAILAAFGASAITGAVTFSITVYSARRQRDRDEQQRQHERERDAEIAEAVDRLAREAAESRSRARNARPLRAPSGIASVTDLPHRP